MEMRKISLDIDDLLYVKLKEEALQNRITMSNILRSLIFKKFGVGKDGTEKARIAE